MQQPPEKLNEICDYAVNSGLNFIVYFGSQHASARFDWLMNFNPAWKNHFLGIYFGDELGGKMLDSKVWFTDFNHDPSFSNVNKYANRSVSQYINEARSIAMYQPDGRIELTRYRLWKRLLTTEISRFTTYYPDGTVTTELQRKAICLVFESENNNAITLSYNQLWSQRPFQTYDETAERFIRNT